MRIVCIGNFIDYQIQLLNALGKKNEVMLVTTTNKLSVDNLKVIDGNVELFRIGTGKRLYHPGNLIVLKNFIRRLYRFKPDVVHVQLGGGIPELILLPFLARYPIISTFHDVKLHLGEESLKHELIRSIFRKCSKHIIVHGETLRKQMIGEYKLPREAVTSIQMGPNEIEPFKIHANKNVKEEGTVILFFGRIAKYKGLEYLIEAEPLITKEMPGVKIIISGAGEDFKKYEDLMVNRENFVVINRVIPYREGAALFQRCSIVVLPYVDASQSAVVMTAYGFKKPVVVTNVGAIPEIVDDGKTGLIVPPKNSTALADAVIKLLKDESLRRAMGENGYEKLYTDLSWDHIAEKTTRIYDLVCSHR